jgi:hypothetical protein
MKRSVQGRVIGGCKLPKVVHGFKLRDFLVSPPPSPASCDYSAPALSVLNDVEGNAQYGDCVEAEDAHYIAVITGNSGNGLYSYTDAQTLADYTAITGFNPNDPSTDQGTDPTVDLNYRVSHGYADGSKDAGWAIVDATNQAEVKLAVTEFGAVKMWFGIPDSIVQNMPSASGFVWDVTAGAPDGQNGHCIGSCGYNIVGANAQGLLVYTWGMLGTITWAAVAAWFASVAGGGMAVRVNMDWVNKASGVTPSGVNATALITAFNTYFSGNVPVPSPTPAPAPMPPPSPSGLVTLTQAQGWAANGINKSSFFLTKAQAIAAANAGLAAGWPRT